jgi:hypothetical protein
MGRLLIALPLLAGLALGALVWRLASAPMESGLLAREIERSADASFAPLRLAVGRATIAWQGFRDGTSPLVVHVTGVRLADPEGGKVAVLPDASVALAIGPLLRGVLSPAALEITGAELNLTRQPDGTLTLAPPGDAPPTAEQRGEVAESRALATVLRDLVAPGGERTTYASLRRMRIHRGEVEVRDVENRLVWRLEGLEISMNRLSGGGLDADGEARLVVTPEGGEPASLPVHLTARAEGRPARVAVRFDLPLFRPAEFAGLGAPLAPLALLDAEVGLQARLGFDVEGRPLGLRVALQAPRGGVLRPAPGFAIPFDALDADVELSGARLAIESGRLTLPGTAGGRFEVSGALSRDGTGWVGPIDLLVTDLGLPGVAELWPPDLAPEAREAARLALAGGTLRRAALRLDLRADEGLSGLYAAGGQVRLLLDEARIAAPGLSPVAIAEATLEGNATPERITLDALRVLLPAPAPDAPAPRLDASGAWQHADGAWRGMLDLAVDRTRFQDLPALWPPGLGEGARAWITGNVTEGDVTGGRWRFGLGFDPAEARLRLDSLEGEAAVSGGVVHFLRPMPPVRGVEARARFAREAITLDATAGSLAFGAEGARAPIAVRAGTLRFLLMAEGESDMADLSFDLAGPLTELSAALRHPRLGLFDRRPFPVTVTGGSFEGRLAIGFPLLDDIPVERLRLSAEARGTGGRFARLLFERDLEEAAFDVAADLDQLRLTGGGTLAAIPLRYQLEADFRAGPANQVQMRDTATARATAEQLAGLGLDAGALVTGPVAIEARGERRRNGQGSYQLTLGLREAAMSFTPLGWRKAPGAEARGEASLRLVNEQLTSIEAIRLTAPELALRGRATLRAGRVERVEIQESTLGGSRFMGDTRAGARPGEPWSVTLRGPVLDLRPVMGSQGSGSGQGGTGSQPPLALDLRFDQLLLGPQREIFALQATGRMDERGVLRQASLRGRTARGAGAFEAAITPGAGQTRSLSGSAEDGGALLRTLGVMRSIDGGRLTLTGSFADSRPGAALSGTAELESFVARDVPAVGKLLQAITVFGIVDAMQGGSGLSFQRAVLPFHLTPETLRIHDARAFSPSLGLTVQGRVQRESGALDLEGTIVPAYVLNTLLGNLPVIGRLFSPETGGGVFAASFRVRGPADDPEVTVNPLAAATPGFLRGLFGGAPEGAGEGGRARR